MITEDYISFEIAKLLKEKGFNNDVLITDWWYDKDGNGYKHQNYSYSGAPVYYEETCYHAPTIQMAMKWLREIHNIHIRLYRIPSKASMVPYVGTDTEPIWEKPWIVSFTKLAPMDEIDTDFDLQEEFPTYEEACEAAIKYCLKNLI